MSEKALILSTQRTPRGRGKKDAGALSGLHPQELAAQTLNQVIQAGNIAAEDVEDVVLGIVSQVGEQGANLTRNAILAAGLPQTISGVSLNRFCGSGLQAVNFAAMAIMSGMLDVAIGGGVESMSRVPLGSDGGGIDGNNLRLRGTTPQVPQGISADLIAKLYGFSRADLDQFAFDTPTPNTFPICTPLAIPAGSSMGPQRFYWPRRHMSKPTDCRPEPGLKRWPPVAANR
jgi:acetyl-CoA C-acetyltransferase